MIKNPSLERNVVPGDKILSFLDLIPSIPRFDIAFENEKLPVTLQSESDKEKISLENKASPALKRILGLVETLSIEELNELNDYIWDLINK